MNTKNKFTDNIDNDDDYDKCRSNRDEGNFNNCHDNNDGQLIRSADWHGQQRAQRERIEFYDTRVREASALLEREYKAGEQPMDVWHEIKLHYIGLLVNHHQPELAETFFNSVTTKILHRSYFQNDFIFVRPAVSTEYIENEETARPTYRAYYPTRGHLAGEHPATRARL